MSRRFVLVTLLVVVLIGTWLVSKAKDEPKAAVQLSEEIQLPQFPESKELTEHIAHLQRIALCLQNDCWQKQAIPSSMCRLSQQFGDIRELYLSLTVKSKDPSVMSVSPKDPRLNVDMEELKKVREQEGKAYLDTLMDNFKSYVSDHGRIDLCAVRREAQPPFHLDELLWRIKEVSEESGWRFKAEPYPAPDVIKSMEDFALAEQMQLYQRGEKTKDQVLSYIRSLGRNSDGYF